MTLLMRDQENLEKGMEKGIKTGKIYGMISICRDMNLSDQAIIRKLEEKFQLTEKEAEMYLQEAEQV